MTELNVGVDEKCRICDYTANGLHFGCQTCRACSEFFRRSVIDKKKYLCSKESQCKMEKSMRYSCKACRYQLCLANGMRTECVQVTRRKQKIHKSDEEKNESTKQIAQTTILEMPPTFIKAIYRMSNGIQNYHWQQRSLFTLLYPDCDPDSYKIVLYEDYIRMARGCTSLVFQTLNDFFPTFADLELDLKESLMRTFSIHFAMLFQCHQTMLKYPEFEDHHFVLHCGQLISCDTVMAFHEKNRDQMAAARQTSLIGDACGQLIDKMRTLKVRQVEMAAILGIKMWNELSFLSSSISKRADRERKRIFKDLFADIEYTFGILKAGPRFGSLLMLLNDLDLVSDLMIQVYTMGRIFDLFEPTIWDN
ncbi:hypothetical protein M3Y97_01078500 [Aphelenchoides bicaudatus]|nr:hypothetical protein M3Y97_01078500 [Aphelenchoides bicaudatus]